MECLERFYDAIDAGGWAALDKTTAVDLLFASRSSAATAMVIMWLRAGRGDADGTRKAAAQAESECETERELAYVLHVETRALFCVRDMERALEAGRRCIHLCRTLGMERLLRQVLITMAILTNVAGLDNLSRAFVEEAVAMRDKVTSGFRRASRTPDNR